MERIQNDGKLKNRCFRGERVHRRQLRENNILQVMTHILHNVQTYKEITQIQTSPMGCMNGGKDKANPIWDS